LTCSAQALALPCQDTKAFLCSEKAHALPYQGTSLALPCQGTCLSCQGTCLSLSRHLACQGT
jgi:hypothetical protein